MRAFILLGPPGAGKGTYAEGLRDTAALLHVATGDMLREEIKAERPLGLQAQAYMLRGELVPDQVIMDLVAARLDREAPATQFLFDGFPRTLEQARLLDEVLAARGGRVHRVYLLETPEEVLIDRISGRRICQGCGAVYHVRNAPPRSADVCDRCGGVLVQRKDDNPDTVRNRLAVYHAQTADLIGYYDQRGLLLRIDASREKDAVLADLMADLAEQ